jgi:hypothetical protein
MSEVTGIDLFTTPPGEREEATCGVCGEPMEVTTGETASGFAAAMAKKYTIRDMWRCKHLEERWHSQAKKLIELAKKTPSKQLAAIYMEDFQEIVTTRECTKPSFGGFGE